ILAREELTRLRQPGQVRSRVTQRHRVDRTGCIGARNGGWRSYTASAVNPTRAPPLARARDRAHREVEERFVLLRAAPGELYLALVIRERDLVPSAQGVERVDERLVEDAQRERLGVRVRGVGLVERGLAERHLALARAVAQRVHERGSSTVD